MRQSEVYKLLEDYPTYAERVMHLNHEIHCIMLALSENCRQMAIQRGELSGMPKSNKISDPVYQAYMETEKLTSQYQEQIRKISMEILDIMGKRAGLERALSTLTGTERVILELRYVNRYGWSRIADRTSYSDRQCRSIKDKAIDKIMVSMR